MKVLKVVFNINVLLIFRNFESHYNKSFLCVTAPVKDEVIDKFVPDFAYKIYLRQICRKQHYIAVIGSGHIHGLFCIVQIVESRNGHKADITVFVVDVSVNGLAEYIENALFRISSVIRNFRTVGEIFDIILRNIINLIYLHFLFLIITYNVVHQKTYLQ